MADISSMTEEEIDAINELASAMRIVQKYDDINYDDLQTIPEIKERLHLIRRGRTIKTLESSVKISRMRELTMRNKQARGKLLQILKEAEGNVFNDLNSMILREYTKVNKEKLRTMCSIYKTTLRQDDYPILVTGEVSSGKSSLINLLLQKDVLPVGHLHTTTTICELRHAIEPQLKSFYWNKKTNAWDKSEELYINQNSNVSTWIKDFMNRTANKKLSSKDFDYANGKLKIYLNLDFLKSEYMLVDSPGIGETKIAIDQVLTYLPKAYATIYVINTSNAGGVQGDRIANLIYEIKEAEKRNFDSFSPELAFFVCNKWDSVDEMERQKVKTDTINKLRRLWPEFEDSQAIFLSTKNAMKHFKAGYVSDDLTALLKALANLIERSLIINIRKYCIWLDSNLNSVGTECNVLHNMLVGTQQQRKKYVSELRSTIDSAKKMIDNQLHKQNVEKVINKWISDIAISIAKFLRSEKFKTIVATWTTDDIQLNHLQGDATSKVRSAITDRINASFAEWDHEHKLVKLATDSVMDEINKEYNHLIKHMIFLEKALRMPPCEIDTLDETFSESESKALLMQFLERYSYSTTEAGDTVSNFVVNICLHARYFPSSVKKIKISTTPNAFNRLSDYVNRRLVNPIRSWITANTDPITQQDKILDKLNKYSATFCTEFINSNPQRQIAELWLSPIKAEFGNFRSQILRHIQKNEKLIFDASGCSQTELFKTQAVIQFVSRTIDKIEKLKNKVATVNADLDYSHRLDSQWESDWRIVQDSIEADMKKMT